MRKMFAILLVCFLFICLPALAGGPTGGVQPRMRPELISRTGSVTLSGPQNSLTGEECTWTVTDTGANPNRIYEFSVGKDDHSYVNEYYTDTQYVAFSRDLSFIWTCYDPGVYYIFLYAYDLSGSSVGDVYFEGEYYTMSGDSAVRLFEVSANPAGDILQTRVQEIAAACARQNDYETALAIFDWIMDNVVYDDSYTWFTADAAILQGCSVCNGYAKAFTLLASAAGLQSSRVLGRTYDDSGQPDDSGGHAWNVVRVNGFWYQLDSTWSAGNQTHTYFLVDDALMRVEHYQDKCDIGTVVCDSLDDNYYVTENLWPVMCGPVIEEVEASLAEGSHYTYSFCSVNVPLEDGYAWSDEYTWHLMGRVAELTLPGYAFHRSSGETLTEPVFETYAEYDMESFWFYIEFYPLQTFRLPPEILSIEEEAFAGVPVYSMIIPGGCQSIGAGAFSGTPLWEIVIPGSVTSIDKTAFDGLACTDLLIYTPEGSPAAVFAQEHGLNWQAY